MSGRENFSSLIRAIDKNVDKRMNMQLGREKLIFQHVKKLV